MTVGCLLSVWLLSAAPASASPRLAAAGPVCNLQTTLRKLHRVPKSYGGPVKQPAHRELLGVTDPTARLGRGTHTTFDGDQAAIQNDAPAARIDENGQAVPSLLPLGLLAGATHSRPNSPAFGLRAPRGPPLAA